MTIFFRNQIRPVKNYDRLGWCMTILRAGHYSKNLQGCKFRGRKPLIFFRWISVPVYDRAVHYSPMDEGSGWTKKNPSLS